MFLRKFILIIFSLSFWAVFSAFQWPWEQQTAQEGPGGVASSPSPANTAVKPTAVGPVEGALVSRPPAASAALQKPAPAANPTSFVIPVPPRAASYQEAMQIRKKINDVIRLNEKLSRINRSKIAEVQTQVEQARIHQQILTELAIPLNTKQVRTSDAEQVLLHKKLRAIREETGQ